MEINVNDVVKVKITKYGKECLRKNYDELNNMCKTWGSKLPYEFELPKEDKDGWTEYQLWELMCELGKYCKMGSVNPIETTIKIVEND